MAYELQDKPDESVTLKSGSTCTPVVTLKDEHGGVSHIIIDDHCYMLVNGNSTVKHWYTEAIAAMQGLPTNPRDLEPAICCACCPTEDQKSEPPAAEDQKPI